MWLKSVYLKTLRDHRVGALAWSLGPGLLMLASMSQFEQLFGAPEQAAALIALAEQFSWYESSVGITRPGGFVTFRLGPMLAILPAVWALLAASGQMRGEEERGALELVLATPIRRTRVVLEKLAALATALLVLAFVLGTLVALAGTVAEVEYGVWDAYLLGLNVALAAGAYGALALLVSQFVSERSAAAAITGLILALSFLLHSTARVSPNVAWLGYFSPLHYYALSKPLVPEVGASPGGMLVLGSIVVVCAGTAAWIFTRRDLGFGLRLFPARSDVTPLVPAFTPYAATGRWDLRSPYVRALRVCARAALWWTVGTAGYAAWMTVVGKQIQTSMAAMAEASPLLSRILARLLDPSGGGAVFLNLLVFTFVPLALSAFAISQVTRWAADEETARTDMLLAQPVSRTRALLAHYAAVGTVIVLVTFALGLVVSLAAALAGLTVDSVTLLVAALALSPILFFVACLGACLAGWLRSGTVASILTAYVVGSFFLVFLGPGLGVPEALVTLAVFDAYGAPLVDGVQWGPMCVVLGISAILLAVAVYRFRQKDLAR